MRKAKPPRLAVGAVLYRTNGEHEIQIALIKKQGGAWTLPKGHVKAHETEPDALHRELVEEIGVDGTIVIVIHEVDCDIIKRDQPRHKVVRYYLVRAHGDKLRPNRQEQIRHARWFSPPEALRRIQNDRVRDMVERAIVRLHHPEPLQRYV